MWLTCRHCQKRQLFPLEQRIEALRRLGKLGPRSKADVEIVDALFADSLDELSCTQCGKLGMRTQADTASTGGAGEQAGGGADPDAWATAIEEDPEAWGESRRCRQCRRTIEAERLDVLPETELCASCAGQPAGDESEEPEYCIRCGGVMQMVRRPGSGLAGYVMRCRDCGLS